MVRMEQVTRRFGSLVALQDVSLDVPPEAVFVLAGPNGAGKSTALKLCLKLIRPSSGRVEIDGVDARRLGPSQLSRIAYVSEHREFPDWMTAAEWFRYLRAFYPAWRDDELAGLVQMHGLPLNRKLRSMSRGQKMQAALCAALAYRPSLLLLDEPFSGLDVLVREQLMETLAERSAETTMMLASHDLTEIESFATHVAYLSDGRLRFVEEMSALSSRFREVEVVLDTPGEEWASATLPSGWLNAEQSGCTVRFVDSQYKAAVIEPEIRSRFGQIREVAVRPLSLRSIFVTLARASAARS